MEGHSPSRCCGCVQGNAHVHDLMPFPDKNFDMSHTINGLSFGEFYPGMKNPLDGITIGMRFLTVSRETSHSVVPFGHSVSHFIGIALL